MVNMLRYHLQTCVGVGMSTSGTESPTSVISIIIKSDYIQQISTTSEYCRCYYSQLIHRTHKNL